MSGKSTYRSSNGTQRPYRDGDRWKAPATKRLPNGQTVKATGTGRTREIAVRRARDNLAAKVAKALAPADASLHTVGGWCKHWLTTIKWQSLKHKTRESYQHALNAWIIPELGDTKLADLRIEHLDQFYARWAASGRSRTAWSTIRTVLNQACDEAVRRQHLDHNPVLMAPSAPKTARNSQYLNESEAAALIRGCNSDDDKARWLMAVVLGLREVVGRNQPFVIARLFQRTGVAFRLDNGRIVLS